MSKLANKYVILVVIIAAVIGLMLVKSPQSEPIPSLAKLTVGLQSGYPPFEFMNDKGHIVGFDVDLANLIAEKLHRSLVIEDMEFEAEIISLKQGQIDLIISGMNITPSRLKEILMIPYHGEAESSLSLLFWNKVPDGVKSIEDLAKLPDHTISVATGTVAENYMENYPNIPIRTFQGSLATLMDIKYGKSAANLAETDVAEYLAQKHPEIKNVPIPVPEKFTILGFGIGIKKGNDALYAEVKQVIDELKNSGQLKALENKWFKETE